MDGDLTDAKRRDDLLGVKTGIEIAPSAHEFVFGQLSMAVTLVSGFEVSQADCNSAE